MSDVDPDYDVREHITRRVTRSRLKLEMSRARGDLAIIAVGIAVFVGCTAIILRNTARQVYTSARQVSFAVSDASGVVGGSRDEVRFKGLPAGVVDSVGLVHGIATLHVTVYSGFGPIYRNARAQLRPETALQNMYLDIVDRGTPAAGVAEANDPIPARQTTVGVQIGDVLQAFNPDVRGHLSVLLRDLGGGLRDRGEALDEAFARVVPFLEVARNLTAQLGVRGNLTRELVHDTALLLSSLASRQRGLHELVNDGTTTLATLAAKRGALDAILRDLPPTLTELNTSLQTLAVGLPPLDDALPLLDDTASRLPDALTALREISTSAYPAVRALPSPLARLTTLASAVPAPASGLMGAASLLRPQVPAADHVTASTAGCPVAVQGFFQWTPSVLKFGDARGYPIRGDAVISLDSTSNLKDPSVQADPSCAPGPTPGGTPGP
jgi:ABC-type transporter Mla subunit MlaD